MTALILKSDTAARRFENADLPLIIGGDSDAAVVLANVEGAVAYLGVDDGRVWIRKGPGNAGVFVNEQPIERFAALAHGDQVRIADRVLRIDTRGGTPTIEVGSTFATIPPDDMPAIHAVDAEPIQPAVYTPTRIESRSAPVFRPMRIVLGGLVLLSALAAWFTFTARSVELIFEPAADEVSVSGGLLRYQLGGRYMLRSGNYGLQANREGYKPFATEIAVTAEPRQSYTFTLEKLPGRIAITTNPAVNAELTADGTPVATLPSGFVELAPGSVKLVVTAPRYRPAERTIEVEGALVEQAVEIALIEDWAPVSFSSSPAGAAVRVNGESRGTTPVTLELNGGDYDIEVGLAGFKTWQSDLAVVDGEEQVLPEIELVPADGRLSVRTVPPGASVTVNGEYRGVTPLNLSLRPGGGYRVGFSKAGYASVTRTVSIESEATRTVDVTLPARLGTVVIRAQPADAELFINGASRGPANQSIELPAVAHRVEVRKAGYQSFSQSITPRQGFEQSLDVVLVRGGKATPTGAVSVAPRMRRIEPGNFQMGAPRREQGRSSNEIERDVEITRSFLLSVHEISNGEFRKFRSGHRSGELRKISLNDDTQPAVEVSWNDAAGYCNWLSDQESLEPVYEIQDRKMIAKTPIPNGYRLPTEAEWVWAARYEGRGVQRKYPWGNAMPPTGSYGNFADASAAPLLAKRIDSFNDGFPATSPVGSFDPNALGIHDLGGNVAEWVHDFYSTNPEELRLISVNPAGPQSGRFHAIRGSSWMHSSITELRFSFRDFSDGRRPDLGFRIARYAE